MLSERARLQPQRIAFTYLEDGEKPEICLTYAELDVAAKAIGARLQQSANPGNRVLLAYPHGLDFIKAFFGCLYAGMIGVPTPAPSSAKRDRSLPRIRAIAEDAEPGVVLSPANLRPAIDQLAAQSAAVKAADWFSTEEVSAELSLAWQEPRIDGDTLAYLQYTSGSTSQPKGVMVTHRNVLDNEAKIHRTCAHTASTVSLGWLPFFHDMGLVGTVLQPIYVGFNCLLMPPASVLQQPLRWLRAMTRFRVTATAAPDFAYQLCVDRIPERELASLELSSWCVAITGAEPIRQETLDNFTRKFEVCGFRRQVFLPCYGLAEATLMVTGTSQSEVARSVSIDRGSLKRDEVVIADDGDAAAVVLVSNGANSDDPHVVIVDPQSLQPCPARRVGEIWISGTSVAKGYWRNAEATADTFGARLAGSQDVGYLRTGDLGLFHDGHLYVTGRYKDVIIIRGSNHYPQDIEATVQGTHAALATARCAAFSVAVGGVERLALVSEIDRHLRKAPKSELLAIVASIRREVASCHGIDVYAVSLVVPGSLPVTSSGKIQRSECRHSFEHGSFRVLASWTATDPAKGRPNRAEHLEGGRPESVSSALELSAQSLLAAEESTRRDSLCIHLQRDLSDVLDLPIDDFNVEVPITRFGLDSMTAFEVLNRLETRLDVQLPISALLEEPSITELADRILGVLQTEARPTGETIVRGSNSGSRGEPQQSAFSGDVHASRDLIEAELCRIWANVLDVGNVGTGDNFFELGGHSLSATQLISRIRESFGVELPFEDLFETPTVAAVAERIRQLHQDSHRATVLPPIRPTGRDGDLPLSFAQQRLWFVDQLSANNSLYNVPTAVRLSGSLNVDALRRSIREIVARHESLRTTFASVDGRPTQVVSEQPDFAFRYEDLSDQPDSDERVTELFRTEAQRRFDLERGPLLRVTLLKVGAAEHALLLTMHHIVSDIWSMGVFLRELSQLYESFRDEGRCSLPALPVQVADFASWQREWQDDDFHQADLAYWKQQLAGVPVLQLPGDHPRPAVPSYRGATLWFEFPATLRNALDELSLQEGVTPFMTLLAAFQVLLCRYSGQDDVVVGTPIAGRTRSEIEDLIGCFINNLALRTNFSGDPSFRELLQRSRETCLGAYSHQGLPFERLVEELQPERDLSREPLFQVMLVLQNAPLPNRRVGDLELSILECDAGTSKFDITLFVWDWTETLAGQIEYNTDLYDESTIRRMLGHLQRLLECATADPEQRISELPLLADDERRQVVSNWSRAAAADTPNVRIDQLIEQQTRRHPDAIAIRLQDRQLSYRELSRRANQLAHALQPLGAGPDVPIAICLEPGIEMLVGILGILKSGSAYLPINPAAPSDRKRLMLQQARAPVVLTQQSCVAGLPDGRQTVLQLDRDWAHIEGNPTHAPIIGANADHLAYVIYTSGSSGPPKGVMISHGNLVHSTCARMSYYDSPVSCYLLLSSFVFDSSVAGLFWTLCQGGTLLLADRNEARDPRRILKLVEKHGVSHLLALPALYELVLDRAAGRVPDSLRSVIVAGEACPVALERHHRASCPGIQLFNEYGPTEATVWSSVYSFAEHPGDTVPIGRPIPGAQLYVLDRDLNPVPAGIPGELCIGGPGLARGYLDHPSQTAERFVPDPFTDDPGGRLYRTGDRGRWRGDGQLEFLGRIDRQVKIRGYRVEPGEIEAALALHVDVDYAAVVAIDEAESSPRLCAYFTSQNGRVPTAGDLRQYLRRSLPVYMVPAVFVQLQEFPLTATGKLDRDALPKPDTARPELDADYIQPRSATEERLAAIWREVLNVERAGVHDDLFELGGHSLVAVQIAARIQDRFHVDLPLRELFETPTIEGLAEAIDRAAKASVVAPIEVADRTRDLPLSFAQQRLWFLHQLAPEQTSFNIPLAVRVSGPLDRKVLKRCLDEIVERHEVLRTTFEEIDGRPVQVVRRRLKVEVPEIDLASIPASLRLGAAHKHARAMVDQPFSLKEGPLLRARLLGLGEGDHVLLLAMHHIVSDAWSLGILIREMAALYAAFRDGEASPLPELPIQYADFACWQRQWLQGDVLEKQLAYWKKQLSDVPLLQLPTDRPRLREPAHIAATHSFNLCTETTRALERLADVERATMFMTLLAAFKVLLCRYTGHDDIVVGTPIANRNRAQAENLIGFFVNILVLRSDLSGNPRFRQVLSRVRDIALAGFAHQDLPCEKIVEELQPDRDLGSGPVAVTFSFQNQPPEEINVAGLQLREFEVPSTTVKCDLSLTMWESDDRLAGVFEYDTDLFDEESIVALSEHFQDLSAAIVADPAAQILDLNFLSAADEESLVAKRRRIAGATPTQQPGPDPGRLSADLELERLVEQTNLSKNQLLVWTGQKLFSEVPLYNTAATLTIDKRVDPERFDKAFSKLIAKSDALRTVIEEIDGLPHQRVLSELQFSVDYHDFSTARSPRSRLDSLVKQRSRLSFDFERRLFDTALIRLGDDEFVWYFNQHHVISDGRSIELIYRHIDRIYGSFGNGRAAGSPNVPQFRRYLKQQQTQRQTAAYQRSREYWQRQLAGECAPIEFYGKSRPVHSVKSESAILDVGAARTHSIISLANDLEVAALSPQLARFALFASALFAYLYRISGHRVISIGMPVLNRSTRTDAETIGLFMHVLPLRVALSERETFESLLKKVTGAVLEAIQHQRYIVRNPPEEPMYNVVLNYRRQPRLEFDGAAARLDEVSIGQAFDPLSIVVRDHDGQESLSVEFQFHSEVFDAEQRQQTQNQFLRVLDALLEDRDSQLRQVSLLSDAESDRLLGSFSGPDSTALPAANASVTELFAAQVRAAPDAPAVQCEEDVLSYKELDERSDRVAAYLRNQAIGPDDAVGLCVERSPEWIVGMLGVLKSGGAYMPLDPTYPRERLQFMLQQSGAQLVLTQRALRDRVPLDDELTLCLDSDWGFEEPHTAAPALSVDEQNVAYIVFTSGSTGTPNAVAVTHGALASYAQSAAGLFEIGPSDRVLQFASIGFDTAAEEIFSTLASGATLVLRDDDMIESAEHFLSECGRLGISVLDLPTAYWHELASVLPQITTDMPPALRLVIIGGEQARSDCSKSWWNSVDSSVRLVNTYGPTESTIVATSCDLTEQDGRLTGAEEVQVPIGRPISTARVYVLDEHLQPVPIGMAGELHIAGTGLARGYLGQPELTAQRFVPNPFSSERGSRLYKTGDRCRFRPDGTLEFIGRTDQQIKVRSHRIELGEIEAALTSHPAIEQAVVSAHHREGIGTQLVAYHVAAPGQAASSQELKQQLRQRLPDYMLPAIFISLERLPLTPHGKIDRKALPMPSGARPELADGYAPPGNDVEEKLASLWCDVLGLDRVGIHDSFFELGGHSLLATRLISRACEIFGVKLPLRRLFEAPTIAAMAELIEESERNGRLPDIPRVSRRASIPLSSAQEGLWFLDQLVSGSVSYNMPTAVRVTGPLDMRALRRALNAVVLRHEAMRTTFPSVDGQPVQSIARELLLDITVEDIGELTGPDRDEQLRRLIEEEMGRPFDLKVGPLIRTRAIRLAEDDIVLMLTMHHIISDGWSIGVFMRELAALYSEFVTGVPAALPELPIQYADFAHWQREWLSDEVLATQLAYWTGQLANLPVLDLPTDRARADDQRFRAATMSHRLPIELSTAARHLSERNGATLFMTLLAAFEVLLSRYSGQFDFSIGSPIANRPRTELEGIIGLFVNTLVLRADLSGDPSFVDFLRRVRQGCLEAYSHKDVPFEKLVQELKPERRLQDTPLFRVLFNFNQHEPHAGDAEMFGLTVEGLAVEGESKFDLTLYVADDGNSIDLGFTYNASLFDPETIAEMSRNYQLLLEAVVDEPRQNLSKLAVGSTTSQQSLIAEFTGSLEEL